MPVDHDAIIPRTLLGKQRNPLVVILLEIPDGIHSVRFANAKVSKKVLVASNPREFWFPFSNQEMTRRVMNVFFRPSDSF